MNNLQTPFNNEQEFHEFINKLEELEKEERKDTFRKLLTLVEVMGPFAVYAINYYYLKNPSEALLMSACLGVVEFMVECGVRDIKEIIDDAKCMSSKIKKNNSLYLSTLDFSRTRGIISQKKDE